MKKINLLFCIILFIMFNGNAFGDCEKGQALYDKAMSYKDIGRRLPLLQKSVDACKNFLAYYQLSEAYIKLNRFKDAEQTLLYVREMMAQDNKAMARIMTRLGQIYEKMGDCRSAYICFQESYRRHPYSKILQKLKSLDTKRMEHGMSAEEIKKALICPAARAFGVEPVLNIFIHFDFNRASLSPEGKEQSHNLGLALSDDDFERNTFTLIGHTDAKGSDKYNMGLSERRARMVRLYLIQNFSKLSGKRLLTEWRGKRELLYPDNPEDALNRRVEIRLNRR